MHIIFSILTNLANLEQNLKKWRGANPANPANPANQENLTRNFQKLARNLCQSIKMALS